MFDNDTDFDVDFEAEEIEDVEETIDETDLEAETDIIETDEFFELSAEKKAAEYVRTFEGFDKCADYVEKHFEGSDYTPGDVIHISTRNQGLEGDDSLDGVSFSRKEIELADGLTIEGVFPEFDSIYHVDLGEKVNDMTLHQQFSACRDDFQEHLFDDKEVLENFTFGDMERMDKPHGYAPEGWTWHHDPYLGSFVLVSSETHSGVGHTGSNAYSGK